VYDSYGSTGGANWLVFGGTSVAAPIIGGVYALAGNASSVSYGSYPYSQTGSLFDVTSGNNGRCRRVPAALCTAGTGWDGPTGLGTPNGVGAF
jgi:subtilase family serine protease